MIVTGDSGAVGFRLGAGPVRMVTERAATRRYWRAATLPASGETPEGTL